MARVSSDIPKELQDSIKKQLERTSVHFIKRTKLETKSNRFEDRILVLATWRLYLFGVKVPAKLESSFNILEIRSLNTVNHAQAAIETDKSTYSLKLQSLDDLDQVISHVNFALNKIFPGPTPVSTLRRITPDTPDSIKKFSPCSDSTNDDIHGTCGGFSETYAALCDYNGMCCREEVQWDVDTIYHSQDNREFSLLDFSHLDGRDLALIVAALAYNQWFTKLQSKDLKLGSEITEQILHTLSKSTRLEELVLENAGLKGDFGLKLSVALVENPNTTLNSINLSYNQLEDKGICNLSQQLGRFPKGLKHVNFSKTAITSKGLVALAQALNSNLILLGALVHLDLSKNPGLLQGEEAANLYNFLGQPNSVKHLDLSGTDCAVDTLFGALLHGCCTHLTYLNLARNAFSHKKVKDALPSFKMFFSSAFSISHVNLSGVRLPTDALRAMLQGLSINSHIIDLHLDISACELRSPGAQVLQEQISEALSVGSLDISDNGFDSDMITLLPALGKNKSLKHVSLGKNFNVKSRTLEDVLQSLVVLIQEDDCSLQSLSVADSRLKSRTSILINALGSNACLTKVDLSGNAMEDIGAKMLSKALQINTTLRSVTWDRNNTTAIGFLDVARALEKCIYIQWYLLRNNRTQKFSQDQAFRLHHGIVTSTAEQMMDRLCVKVQDDVRALRNCPIESIQEDVLYAKEMIKDARNSRALFPSLYELGHVLAADGPVRHRLESVASEVSKAVDKELQVILESMVCLTQELCPNAARSAEGHQKMFSSISDQVTIPRNFVRSVLLEQAGVDIQNKLNEVKLTVVSYLTNSIVDEILQELYLSHKKLSRHMTQIRKLAEQEAGIMGILQDKPGTNRQREAEDMTDDELSTSIDTIAIRRQTVHSRKIRPVSTFISMSELDLDRQTLESPSGLLSSSTSSQYSHSRSTSFEALIDLPTEGTKLDHQTRVRPRPRRNNRQPPSKPPPAQVTDPLRQEDKNGSRIDEGVEEFFKKKVIPDANHPQTPRSRTESSSGEPPPQKKRKGQKRSLFNFRKNRGTKLQDSLDSESRAGPSSSSSLQAAEPKPPSTQDPPRSLHPSSGDPTKPHGKAEAGDRMLGRAATPEEAEANGRLQDRECLVEAWPAQGILLPGMGGVRGLPSRVRQERNAMATEERAELQPNRVHGILLPGMGGAKGWSPEWKSDKNNLEKDTLSKDKEARRHSEDSGPCGWKPQPPLQSQKPNLMISRKSKACWLAEEGESESPRESCNGTLSDGAEDGTNRQEGKAPMPLERTMLLPPAGHRNAAGEKTKENFPEPAPRTQRQVLLPPSGRKLTTAAQNSPEERKRNPTGLPATVEESKRSVTPPPPPPPSAKPHFKPEETKTEIQEGDDKETPKHNERAGRRVAPLKPTRSRRAKSCDKLDQNRAKPSEEEEEGEGAREQVPVAPAAPAGGGNGTGKDTITELLGSLERKRTQRHAKIPLNLRFASLDGVLNSNQDSETGRSDSQP
nr:PREDICTED: leucine-rich repeat-containing protein 16B [Latimeria chalumnae]|eukprot:XP_014342943.1 PREDICTED: leucine-rich repeat-containing protein 16B [Latimeria chalumnae]